MSIKKGSFICQFSQIERMKFVLFLQDFGTSFPFPGREDDPAGEKENKIVDIAPALMVLSLG